MTAAQRAWLEVIRTSSHNAMNGRQIAEDLENHRELWVAAVPGKKGGGKWPADNMLELMDNVNDADTLYILPTGGREDELAALVARWRATTMTSERISAPAIPDPVDPVMNYHDIWPVILWWD